ncbi:MAG TPA: permease prefix domain 1-containing protein [Acidobacteriota bacterium]|nr:permease prefix domain 1-containing protein [Acidobacteriota bacterium]
MRDRFPRLKRAFAQPEDDRTIIEEIDAELASHLEDSINQLIKDGMSRREALEETSRRFGDLVEYRRRMQRQRRLGELADEE